MPQVTAPSHAITKLLQLHVTMESVSGALPSSKRFTVSWTQHLRFIANRFFMAVLAVLFGVGAVYLVGDLVLFRASGVEFLEQLIAMGGFLFLSVGMLNRVAHTKSDWTQFKAENGTSHKLRFRVTQDGLTIEEQFWSWDEIERIEAFWGAQFILTIRRFGGEDSRISIVRTSDAALSWLLWLLRENKGKGGGGAAALPEPLQQLRKDGVRQG